MWEPVTRQELDVMLAEQLADCSEHLRGVFARHAIAPAKWRQTPHGDLGGGFWAVALNAPKVLWYNDIEEGFNVSRYVALGRIPDDEYRCQQDPLTWAIPALVAPIPK